MRYQKGRHRHYRLPRHAGGTNVHSNLVYLTIEEHALAHKALYQQYGRWQDEVAWKALSGQIVGDEIRHLIAVRRMTGANNHMFGKPSPMAGKKHTEETKKIIKEKRAKQKIAHSEETKRKIGLAHKGKIIPDHQRRRVSQSNKTRVLTPRSEESRKNMSEIIKNLPKLKCPYCGGEYDARNAARWHFNNCKHKKVSV